MCLFTPYKVVFGDIVYLVCHNIKIGKEETLLWTSLIIMQHFKFLNLSWNLWSVQISELLFF